jgi:aspartate kinase
MAEKILVQKYGGTSVGTPEKIVNIARRIIESRKKCPNIVVVVSAMGDTTDDLIELIKGITDNPSAREYDALISTGENVSAASMAMALMAQGQDAISLTGPQAGITTSRHYSRAKIEGVDPTRIQNELKAGKVVIVTGFQGLNEQNDVTTIGRGGSDTSAVVLAAALGSYECEIYTDVDGVYTTDPRVVSTAKKLDEISYDEMLELASLGAKVLHPRAVECAKENDIILHVRSSYNNNEGTRVKEVSNLEVHKSVTGITLNEEEAILSILKVSDQPGVAGKVFGQLAEAHINVDMIIQSVEENEINNITFTVSEDDVTEAEKITRDIAESLGANGVRRLDSIAKISIVGVGMISKPGVAAKMFEVLGENKINIHLISTSEIKVSCAIDKEKGKEALELLHKTFELDK